MRFVAILIVLLLLVALGGFAWLGFADVPLEQKEVVKEIPYDSLSNTP